MQADDYKQGKIYKQQEKAGRKKTQGKIRNYSGKKEIGEKNNINKIPERNMQPSRVFREKEKYQQIFRNKKGMKSGQEEGSHIGRTSA